jgi:hypothetical protein
MKYANQPKALGICDRCGQSFKLNTLRRQVIDEKLTKIFVCRKCEDIDQEQLQLGKIKADDAIALRDPRPDTAPGREPLVPFSFPFLNSP